MLVPIWRRHAAFLPVIPVRVSQKRGPHLVSGKVVAFAKILERSRQIDGDDDSAYIENDRLGAFEQRAATDWHGYFLSDGVAATGSELFVFPASLARSTLMTGGSKDRKITPAMT